MIEDELYKPFTDFHFDDHHCFITGEKTNGSEFMSVFPEWLVVEFELQNRPFKLLDESFTTFQLLRIPCKTSILENFIKPLQCKVETASKSGFTGFSQLSETEIFQWTGLMMYGIIYNELKLALSQRENNEPLSIAPSLIKKFSNHHLALLSIIHQIEFDEQKPWSIFLFDVKQGAHVFDYRDELNTMIFSSQFNGIGLVICLQDHGANKNYHKEIYTKIKNKKLHPIQFQELAARIYYSGYLLNPSAEIIITKNSGSLVLSPMPFSVMPGKRLFANWENKTYAQVLEAFWQSWGFVKFEILKDPENPISFIERDGKLLDEKSIELPL